MIMSEKRHSTEFYDVVRVIATLFVVIGHASYPAWSGDGGTIVLSAEGACGTYDVLFCFLSKLGGWIYGFHMPLFFMLSGAVYTYSRKRDCFNTLIKSKFLRLVVPFYLTGILYMFPIKYISGFYTRETIKEAVLSFVFTQNSGHLWFLIALFWCLLLFYPIEKYITRKAPWAGLLIACVIYNANCNGFLELECIGAIPGMRNAITYLPYFIGGYLFEELRKNYKINKVVLFVVTLCLVGTSILQYEKNIIPTPVLVVLLGAMTVYAISFWISSIPRLGGNNIHRVLLRNSMYIYLFHEPINFLMLRWAINTGAVYDSFKTVIYFFGRTVVAVVIPILLGEVIARIKMKTKFSVFVTR